MERCVLELYIAGKSSRSQYAINDIKKMCEEELGDKYLLNIIDIFENPKKAAGSAIIATPALIRKSPLPEKKVFGDISDKKIVMGVLELDSHTAES